MSPGDLCCPGPKMSSEQEVVQPAHRNVSTRGIAGAGSLGGSWRQTFSLLEGHSCCISPIGGEGEGHPAAHTQHPQFHLERAQMM